MRTAHKKVDALNLLQHRLYKAMSERPSPFPVKGAASG